MCLFDLLEEIWPPLAHYLHPPHGHPPQPGGQGPAVPKQGQHEQPTQHGP